MLYYNYTVKDGVGYMPDMSFKMLLMLSTAGFNSYVSTFTNSVF